MNLMHDTGYNQLVLVHTGPDTMCSVLGTTDDACSICGMFGTIACTVGVAVALGMESSGNEILRRFSFVGFGGFFLSVDSRSFSFGCGSSAVKLARLNFFCGPPCLPTISVCIGFTGGRLSELKLELNYLIVA